MSLVGRLPSWSRVRSAAMKHRRAFGSEGPGGAALIARAARYAALIAALVVAAYGLLLVASQPPLFGAAHHPLDAQRRGRLAPLGFTGDREATLQTRPGGGPGAPGGGRGRRAAAGRSIPALRISADCCGSTPPPVCTATTAAPA